MQTSIRQEVIHLIKQTDEEQKQGLRKFIKMPLESRVSVLGLSRKLFYQLKQNNPFTDIVLLSYVSLIKAISSSEDRTSEVDKNIASLKAQSIKKTPKLDKLLSYWALIKELKIENGLSFRQIQKYLSKHHRLEVAHSSIYDMWHELEVRNRGEN